MKYEWKDLPKPLNCFTVRSATMVNLNTGKIISNYAANTKIVVVQKCVTPTGAFYRTAEAKHHYLNYAFRASAFGLPDEKAPSAPSSKPNSLEKNYHPLKSTSTKRAQSSKKKQTSSKTTVSPKDGGEKQHKSWFSRLFRRKNGKAKNS